MNRWLAIPAACCLIAFLALWLSLGGAAGRESIRGVTIAPSFVATTSAAPRTRAEGMLIALDEVERSLTALSGEYMRPWRQIEKSPRYLYSRVAPREIPSISADVELATAENADADGIAVGTICVSKGTQFETIPCVVDRHTGSTRLFAGGKWLTANDWISQAPQPN